MKIQRGAAMPEFALIALLFFIVLFAAIEMGRWMFIWNTLVESTRRGARIATVCPPSHPYIQIAAVFGDPDQAAPQNSPVLPNLSTNDVTVVYYEIVQSGTNPSNGVRVATTNPADMKLAEVTINYTHTFIVPVIGNIMGLIASPTFQTILPMESMGDRQAVPNHCF